MAGAHAFTWDQLEALLPAGVQIDNRDEGDPGDTLVTIGMGEFIIKNPPEEVGTTSIMKNGLVTHLVKRTGSRSVGTLVTLTFIVEPANAKIEYISPSGAVEVLNNTLTNITGGATLTFRFSAEGYVTQTKNFYVFANVANQIVPATLHRVGINMMVNLSAVNPNRQSLLGTQLARFTNYSTGAFFSGNLSATPTAVNLSDGEVYQCWVGDNGFIPKAEDITAQENGTHTIELQWGGREATIELRNATTNALIPGILTIIGTNVLGVIATRSLTSLTGIFEIDVTDHETYQVIVNIQGFHTLNGSHLIDAGDTLILSLTEQVAEVIEDPAGNEYEIALINGRKWTIENFNYSGPNNNGTVGRAYQDNPANALKWGRLYTMAEIQNQILPQMAIIAPGYHLPDEADLRSLYVAAGNSRGLKKVGAWPSGNQMETNSLRFSALPGGYYQSGFQQGNDSGFFWTRTQVSPYVATVLQITGGDDIVWNESMGVEARCSLRLIKD